MDLATFQKAAGINAEFGVRWYQHFTLACKEFSINTAISQSQFIAQLGHESGGWTQLTESLNYKPETLIKHYVPKYLTLDQANKLGKHADEDKVPVERQKIIANLIYDNRDGNYLPNDGWDFRGRGLIQLTGRDNYLRCGKALGIDLINNPDLLAKDEFAMRAAAWFFSEVGGITHANDVKKVTHLINGGSNGLPDRLARFTQAKTILVV